MRRSVFLLAVFLFLALPSFADEGHGEVEHHEDLTSEQLGTVHFPISCAQSAQEPFTRGVALLHSFWYEEAEKAFDEAAKGDSQCAMAHWGVAMSLWHQLWNNTDKATDERGLAEVKKAQSLHAKTRRERDYIAAIKAYYSSSRKRDHHARATAYCNAMEQVYTRYPDDHEAAAFYALSLLASEPENDTDFANRKKAAAVLEKLFAVVPDHPGVTHYLIHAYDKPAMAELGLPAARRYARIAPAAPHALHMPSHIFARLGLWQEDIDSNLASIAATRKSTAMHMGGEGHQFHAMDFLVYAYLQSGHEEEVQRLIAEVKAMPPMQDMYGEGFDPRIASLVDFEAAYPLELHHWADAAALEPVPGATNAAPSVTYRARAIGAAHLGNVLEARKDLSQIEAIHQAMIEQKKTSFADAVDQDRREALAWIDHAEGKNEEAIPLLRAIADKEDGALGAGDALPAREMLADMLLEMKHPEQALAEYEADLKVNPNRFDGLYGAARAAEMAGKNDQAKTYYAQLVKQCDGSNSERPELGQAKELLARK